MSEIVNVIAAPALRQLVHASASPPPLSPPFAWGGLADLPSSPRPPSMRRAGARAEMRQRPPFVLHTSELADGGRGSEPFLGKWSCAGSHGTSYARRRAVEAAVVALKRPGIQGMRGSESARADAVLSLSYSLPPVCTPRHSVGSSLHRTRTLRSHMQKGECDQRTNAWLGSKFYAHWE